MPRISKTLPAPPAPREEPVGIPPEEEAAQAVRDEVYAVKEPEEAYVPPRPEIPRPGPNKPKTKIHGRDDPIVFGMCAAEAQVIGSPLEGQLNEDAVHRLHARCPGALINGDGTTVLCGCPRHKAEHRCHICGHVEETGEGFDADRRRCLDVEACADRLHEKATSAANTPTAKMIREVRAISRRGEATDPTSPRPVSTRRVGRKCQDGCGLMTGGGLFRPGHDAKLKSVLTRAALAGDVAAAVELQARHWPSPEVPLGSVELTYLQNEEARQAYIAARVEARYATTEGEQQGVGSGD